MPITVSVSTCAYYSVSVYLCLLQWQCLPVPITVAVSICACYSGSVYLCLLQCHCLPVSITVSVCLLEWKLQTLTLRSVTVEILVITYISIRPVTIQYSQACYISYKSHNLLHFSQKSPFAEISPACYLSYRSLTSHLLYISHGCSLLHRSRRQVNCRTHLP